MTTTALPTPTDRRIAGAAWDMLAALGFVDARGSGEYRRVLLGHESDDTLCRVLAGDDPDSLECPGNRVAEFAEAARELARRVVGDSRVYALVGPSSSGDPSPGDGCYAAVDPTEPGNCPCGAPAELEPRRDGAPPYLTCEAHIGWPHTRRSLFDWPELVADD